MIPNILNTIVGIALVYCAILAPQSTAQYSLGAGRRRHRHHCVGAVGTKQRQG